MRSSTVLGGFDVAIVVAYLLWAIVSGLRARKSAAEGLEQYFLAGRKLPGWKAGLSMAATQFASDTPLLVTGLVATAGIAALWRLWIYAVAFLLLGFLLAGPWRRAGVLTDAELAELRYGGRAGVALRAFKAVYFGTVINCVGLAMVMVAAVRIAEPLLPWQEWLPASVLDVVVAFVRAIDLRLCIDPAAGNWATASASNVVSLAAIVGTTALYSTTGGLRAVVDTDVVQLAIAIGATAIYAVFIVAAVGGLGDLPSGLARLYGSSHAAEITSFVPESLGALALAAISVQWLAQTGSDGSGYLAQRAMACRNESEALSATLWFVIVQILIRSLLWLPIALGLLVLFPFADGELLAARERTYVDGFVALLPPGCIGLMAVGMLAALASTVDTHLNWGASYWTHDIYDRLLCRGWRGRKPSDRSLVWVARGSTLALLALALVVMGRITSIRQAWMTGLLLGAAVGIPLVARWLWWRVTAMTELVAIASALVLAPVLAFALDDESLRVLAMAGVSVVITLATAAANRRGPDPACIEFYRRVRPPGVWGPAARACGEDPKLPLVRLRAGLLLTAAVALAVFCGLTGVGSILVGSPAPSFFPWRAAWIAANLFVALAIPLALWRLRRRA